MEKVYICESRIIRESSDYLSIHKTEDGALKEAIGNADRFIFDLKPSIQKQYKLLKDSAISCEEKHNLIEFFNDNHYDRVIEVYEDEIKD